jgi:iron-only hydrogenase group A
MITSCSPGWINFLEMFYPDMIKHHSSCKSPQQMFGALAKTFYAEKQKLDPAKIVSVSIMPCTAKKFEANRPEMRASGYKDVDYVLTTRELGKLIKSAGININEVKPQDYDPIMGEGTGAATIFGVTGGVMEAALRFAYEAVTGETLNQLEFAAVRGLTGIKEAEVDLKGTKVKVAVGHGMGNARQILESIKAGNPNKWNFIEIMGCPGGCISGGGQPISHEMDFRTQRTNGLYEDDKNLPHRKSQDNSEVKAIYAEYLGKPCGDKSHKLLHSHAIHGHKGHH